MRAIPFKNPEIKALCIAAVAKGDKLLENGRTARSRWSISEEMEYWRARCMIAEDELAFHKNDDPPTPA